MTRQHYSQSLCGSSQALHGWQEGWLPIAWAEGTGYREPSAIRKWAGRMVQLSTDKFLLNSFLWKSHYRKSWLLPRSLFQGAAASAPGSPPCLTGPARLRAPCQLPRAISPYASLARIQLGTALPCLGTPAHPHPEPASPVPPSVSSAAAVLARVACLDRPPGAQWQGLLYRWDNLLDHFWCQFKCESLPCSTEADEERPFLRGHSLFINYNLIKWKDQHVIYSKTHHSFPSGGGLWYT